MDQMDEEKDLQTKFDKSTKPAGRKFISETERLIQNIIDEKIQNNLFFIDKNHPPNAIENIIKTI